jgi:hypothetical protein
VFWLLHCTVNVRRCPPRLVAGFVKILRYDFLKTKSTFLRWSLPLTRLFTAFTGVPTTQRHRPLLLPPSTRWTSVLMCRRMDLTRWLDCQLPELLFFGLFLLLFIMLLGLLFHFRGDSCIWICVGTSFFCSHIFEL